MISKKLLALFLLLGFGIAEGITSLIIWIFDLKWSILGIVSGILILLILGSVVFYLILMWKFGKGEEKPEPISSPEAVMIAKNILKYGMEKEPEKLSQAIEPSPDEFEGYSVTPEHIEYEGGEPELIFAVEGRGKIHNKEYFIGINALKPSLFQKGANLTVQEKEKLKRRLSRHPPIEEKIEGLPYFDEATGQQRMKFTKTRITPSQKKEEEKKQEEAKKEL